MESRAGGRGRRAAVRVLSLQADFQHLRVHVESEQQTTRPMRFSLLASKGFPTRTPTVGEEADVSERDQRERGTETRLPRRATQRSSLQSCLRPRAQHRRPDAVPTRASPRACQSGRRGRRSLARLYRVRVRAVQSPSLSRPRVSAECKRSTALKSTCSSFDSDLSPRFERFPLAGCAQAARTATRSVRPLPWPGCDSLRFPALTHSRLDCSASLNKATLMVRIARRSDR